MIPGIGVSARVVALGGSRFGKLAVPSLGDAFAAGWYTFTAVPGRPGNSVIVGHVDTYFGPAVFYDLYLLRPGYRMYVEFGAHDREGFTVRRVREVRKASFPAAEIFGRTRARRLWLITCGGGFDYATHHYMDNIIVSASHF